MPWFAAQIDCAARRLSLHTTPPRKSPPTCCCSTAAPPATAVADARYLPETGVVQFTVGTSENAAPGIFHKLTGALTSQGLRNPLGRNQHAGRRPGARPLLGPRPRFRRRAAARAAASRSARRWSSRLERPIDAAADLSPHLASAAARAVALPAAPDPRHVRQHHVRPATRIVDIFTHDRTGLLYTITRTLFELGLSVWRAKIGTYLDQVVDVFYVTDQRGQQDRTTSGIWRRSGQRLLDVLKQ